MKGDARVFVLDAIRNLIGRCVDWYLRRVVCR